MKIFIIRVASVFLHSNSYSAYTDLSLNTATPFATTQTPSVTPSPPTSSPPPTPPHYQPQPCLPRSHLHRGGGEAGLEGDRSEAGLEGDRSEIKDSNRARVCQQDELGSFVAPEDLQGR
ncbi:hypothetical protein CASFOL_018516 [Castilleja foliolosa]|uniref:Uncharacterized protein n=1 Tax=Castilleja foliolosa TaxID=1961234 RepID=A0ABD3D9R8_9LAMI